MNEEERKDDLLVPRDEPWSTPFYGWLVGALLALIIGASSTGSMMAVAGVGLAVWIMWLLYDGRR